MDAERTYNLYCGNILTLEELHVALAALLSFPAYYGRNFDALHDCLSDLAVQSPFMLNIHQWDALEEHIGIPRCLVFRHVLQDVADEYDFEFHID